MRLAEWSKIKPDDHVSSNPRDIILRDYNLVKPWKETQLGLSTQL
jgi:hypothetical protein